MKVRIIFNKDAQNKKLHTGWGVSFLVDGKVLFDTGEKGAWLTGNMDKLGVEINEIRAVVISHDHWDHTGGLWELLKNKEGLKVYVCSNVSGKLKNKIKESKGVLEEVKGITEICKNIFLTGEIEGEYKGEYLSEQALVAKTDRGISLITGCAHPGITKMLEKVKNDFPEETIYAVLGGFHLLNEKDEIIMSIADDFKRKGVKKAGPTHCSGDVAEEIFKLRYKDDFLQMETGRELEI